MSDEIKALLSDAAFIAFDDGRNNYSLAASAKDRIEELEAENKRLREAQAWRPIETAPQIDEHRILVSDGKLVMIAEWVAGKHVEGGVGEWAEVLGDSCEYTRFSMKLTHWMPLPEPPKETDK